MRAAIYARVSSEEQKTDMQLVELREYVGRMGWDAVEYVEKMSSVKARPVFEKLMADARLRRFDVVVVWKLDRFARSVHQLLDSVLEMKGCGVSFLAPTQGIDTRDQNPHGRFLMQIMGAFAELERSMIVDRVNAGLKQYKDSYGTARQRPSKSGKNLPVGRQKRVIDVSKLRALRESGMSLSEIAAATGEAKPTIARRLKSVALVSPSVAKV